jgi:hypothetical protein
MKSQAYEDVLTRLSERSVTKHFDAYADVDWDAEPIDRHDPRFELPRTRGLGATDWYASLPADVRAELGLAIVTQQMKVGVFFENILSKGLLEFAMTQPERSPAFRYAYHEVIEEGQHSLMFQEFINRTGLTPPGVGPVRKRAAGMLVPRFGRTFPELFFILALGGEAPIDYVQRRILRDKKNLHPTLERIVRIHVLEEARHICFAREYLREHVPQLGPVGRNVLKVRVPIAMAVMSRQMLVPPASLRDRFAIPSSVVREAWTENEDHAGDLLRGTAPIRDLCLELGVITPRTKWIWRRLGIWD